MTKIEILGANCGYCRAMEATARQAATRLGVECEIVKVTEPQKFIDYNVRAIRFGSAGPPAANATSG
jgi:hypothetical protein